MRRVREVGLFGEQLFEDRRERRRGRRRVDAGALQVTVSYVPLDPRGTSNDTPSWPSTSRQCQRPHTKMATATTNHASRHSLVAHHKAAAI